MRAIVAAFNAAHAADGVRVDMTFFPDFQYTEKISIAAAARDLPDAFDIDGPLVARYVDAGLLAPLGPSILVAHSRPDNHRDPERFDPTRFLGATPAANTWIPFGGGVRRCIGAGFSLMEGVEVLRQVLTAYDVTSVGDDRPLVRNITSVPRRGARIRVS